MRRLFIVAFALLSIQGCRDTDTGVQITGNSDPTDECEFDTETILLTGSWDLAARGTYMMAPIVESRLVSRSLDIQSEANNVTIQELEVELFSPDGEPLDTGSLPNPYKVLASAFLPATEGGTPTEAVAFATVVPADYLSSVGALLDPTTGSGQLLIEIQAAGSTAGSLGIKTVDFPWSVSLCAGCLAVDCGSDSTDDEATQGCLPAQDGTGYCALDNADAGELGDDAGAM